MILIIVIKKRNNFIVYSWSIGVSHTKGAGLSGTRVEDTPNKSDYKNYINLLYIATQFQ